MRRLLGVEGFERVARRLHFSLRLGGFEQGLNLVDFVDEFVAGHVAEVKVLNGQATTTNST